MEKISNVLKKLEDEQKRKEYEISFVIAYDITAKENKIVINEGNRDNLRSIIELNGGIYVSDSYYEFKNKSVEHSLYVITEIKKLKSFDEKTNIRVIFCQNDKLYSLPWDQVDEFLKTNK